MVLQFIAAINGLNQPWVAIIVIVLGMIFDVVCQKYGVSNDAATGVIGAGIGLLTGQALHAVQSASSPTTTSTVGPPPVPIKPDPAPVVAATKEA